MSILMQGRGLGAQNITTHPDAAIAAATQVAVMAANAARVTAVVQNSGANAARIGDAHTGAAQGIILSAGESFTIDTTDAIYAYSTTGTTLTITETVRP